MQRVVSYTNYMTRQGDTFDSLALSLYNDEKKAHLIIQFNPDYSDVIIFESNVALRLPKYDELESIENLPPWRQR